MREGWERGKGGGERERESELKYNQIQTDELTDILCRFPIEHLECLCLSWFELSVGRLHVHTTSYKHTHTHTHDNNYACISTNLGLDSSNLALCQRPFRAQ